MRKQTEKVEVEPPSTAGQRGWPLAHQKPYGSFANQSHICVMETVAIDRLRMRARPDGSTIMYQNWDNLLFLHWPIEASVLRPLIPPELEIDLFEDTAWIGITPFAVTGLRIASVRLPGLDSFQEL